MPAGASYASDRKHQNRIYSKTKYYEPSTKWNVEKDMELTRPKSRQPTKEANN